jgi:hypothetical protein
MHTNPQFYFEKHINFKPMHAAWAGSFGEDTSLAKSYATFAELRKYGIRAHFWV